MVKRQKEFQVEAITGMKSSKGGKMYQVKWKGWPSSDSTWEPLRNLDNCMPLVSAFEKKQTATKKKPTLKAKKATKPAPKMKKVPVPRAAKKRAVSFA